MRYFSLILLLLPILGNSQNINLNENIQTLIDNLRFDIEHDKDFKGTSDSIRIFVNGIRFNSEQLTQFDAKGFVSIEVEKHGLERLKDAMEYDKAILTPNFRTSGLVDILVQKKLLNEEISPQIFS